MGYLGLVIVALILNEIIGKRTHGKQWIIRCVVSLFFYILIAKFKVVFLLVSAFSIWIAGLSFDFKVNRRFIFWGVFALNIGLLVCVKYIFTSDSSIVAPLGISFYTLCAVSYLIDVYNGKYLPERNFFKLFLFVSWFPQMIQGPINRYDSIKEDLYSDHFVSWGELKTSALLFLFGAIKKYAIADALMPSVNEILGNDVSVLPGAYLLFGAVLFAIAQYADFSGGIDMVLAVSNVLGVKMADNFLQPYFSKSISEFWRRWHISLGAWMRDYIFYPFAISKPIAKFTKKNNKRFGKQISRSITGGIANIIVFSLVGLWHGPQLHYLIWGLYNGLIIAISDALVPLFTKMKGFARIDDNSCGFKLFQIIRTFILIVFAGYFDIVSDVKSGLICFRNTFSNFGLNKSCSLILALFSDELLTTRLIMVVCVAIVLVLFTSILKEKNIKPYAWLESKALPIRWIVYYMFIFLLLFSFTAISGIGGFMYAAF